VGRESQRPLALFLDEVDSLYGEGLLSLLRQLRDGFPHRPQDFPTSIALVGLRDVRDYVLLAGGSGGPGSPFNIKTASLTLRNFTRDEIAELYLQHTEETGQRFLPQAIDRAYYQTAGQPWLVNAIAAEIVDFRVTDRNTPVTASHIDGAAHVLIDRQDTHLDSLAHRLQEPRIRSVVGPILAGDTMEVVPEDARRYAIDLGLVRRSRFGRLEIANPIYREIIPRFLAQFVQDTLPAVYPTWLTEDGRLDADRLLLAFLDFWRQHGEALLRAAPFHEIAPHLVLMAFLHRVENGGGRVEREYAIGTGRIDLVLRYGPDTVAMELKVWRPRQADPLEQGLKQLDHYLAGLGLEQGWLVIFDRRPDLPSFAQRTTVEEDTTPSGRAVKVVRA